MSERLKIENLYKVFSPAPQKAMALLRSGAGKDRVFQETKTVVGVNNVSLTVPEGAMYMIMGLSGSGNSTLARCINRLNEPTEGRILLDGRDIVPLKPAELRDVRRTRMSMVFQHFALLPNKTVVENTEFGLKMRGIAAAERRRRAEEVLSIVGLSQWAYNFPSELSGGMRQRVGLARALATDADLLIMDEAFSALDPLIRAEMQDELLRLQRTLRKTVIFITHDFQEALKLGTLIAIMKDGEVVREGSPQSIVSDPGNDYVAAFTREVDRSRVFEARSLMQPCQEISQSGNVRLVGRPGPDPTMAFALDKAGRIVGYLDQKGLSRHSQGERAGDLLSNDFVKVPAATKVIDVARLHRIGQPMAVVEGDDRFIGLLEPDQIIACIAATSAGATPTTHGATHA